MSTRKSLVVTAYLAKPPSVTIEVFSVDAMQPYRSPLGIIFPSWNYKKLVAFCNAAEAANGTAGRHHGAGEAALKKAAHMRARSSTLPNGVVARRNQAEPKLTRGHQGSLVTCCAWSNRGAEKGAEVRREVEGGEEILLSTLYNGLRYLWKIQGP